jgi:S-adenosylmethionine decarboxylase proenzyme, Bacillus form
MEALGRQILAEFYQCSESKINDVSYVESAMLEATKASHATIVSHTFHKFSPYGVSGVVVIAESHVAIHTWPEYNYAAVDIFTCGETIDPWIIQETLKNLFDSESVSSMELKRGMFKVPAGEKLLFKPTAEQETAPLAG